MLLLKKIIKEALKGARRTAVLCIGSELRGDDAAGILVAKGLRKALKKKAGNAKFEVFIGSTAPENMTGEIRAYRPTHVIMVDSAEMGKKTGTISVLKPEEINSGITFSTHVMPVWILAEYLSKSFKCKVVIIGIQPKTLKFGKPASEEVKKSAKEVALSIKAAVENM
ncbi:MAG: hydrogenase maturation peptidase HycI [Candidatus Omnitrophica bacterium]|nr:hydrogenase maturation peptidase HycI [Candidatus Omnitrophota bacterium]